ncbi:MAG: chemotaxis protein CheW [Candidatus Acidiferrum sp.]
MRVASPPAKPPAARTEQIILFRVSGLLFAVSSASVQEVRSVDSLSGAATEVNQPGLRKVRHVLRRGDKAIYVINAAAHFGLPSTAAGLVFVLRKTRTALLVEAMDKMATMTRLQALPLAYCHEERGWYRGLTALDQHVIPVVNPEGFLTEAEFALLDASLPPLETAEETESGSSELPQ